MSGPDLGPAAAAGWPGGGWTPTPPDPRRLPARLRPALPIEEHDHAQFWRAPRYRWWKGLLAAAMATALFLVVSTLATLIGWAIDGADLSVLARGEIPAVGPGFFLANNISLALCIPIAGLTAWACVQQSPRWLSSVTGGIRWRWLLTVVAALLPLWLVVVGTQTLLGSWGQMAVREHTWVMVAGILLTTPFQAAGEEYLVRGLAMRVVGSWIRPRLVAFLVSAVVASLIFMGLHGAGDPWLNGYYFAFGFAAAWVTWRTGGLEAAIALHVVNNLVAEATLPFVDFSDMFDREAGVGDASILINVGVLALGVVLVEWLARRRGMVATAAPGRGAWESLSLAGPTYGPTALPPRQPW